MNRQSTTVHHYSACTHLNIKKVPLATNDNLSSPIIGSGPNTVNEHSMDTSSSASLASQAIFHGRKWAGWSEGKIRLVTVASIPRASAGMLAAPIRFRSWVIHMTSGKGCGFTCKTVHAWRMDRGVLVCWGGWTSDSELCWYSRLFRTAS